MTHIPQTTGFKATLTQLVLALVVLLGGCGAVEYKTSSELNPTEIAPNKAVSIVLNRYRYCGDPGKEDCWDDSSSESNSSSESKEADLADCVGKSLIKEQPKLRILPPKEFRRFAFPNKEFLASPRSPEAIIDLLSNAQFKERVDSAHVRYLVVLDMGTSKTFNKTEAMDARPILVIGRSWTIYSHLEATVIDTRHAVKTGNAETWVSGNAGYLVPLAFGIVPLIYAPIIPYFSRPESRACTELGHELGQKFFLKAGAVQAPE